MPQPCRGVAQLVAHLVWDQGVGSSNLSAPTKILFDFLNVALIQPGPRVYCLCHKLEAIISDISHYSPLIPRYCQREAENFQTPFVPQNG